MSDETWAGLSRTTYPTLSANLTAKPRPLTMELLESFATAMINAGPPPEHQHMVNSTALARGGWTICASCLNPIHIPLPATWPR